MRPVARVCPPHSHRQPGAARSLPNLADIATVVHVEPTDAGANTDNVTGRGSTVAGEIAQGDVPVAGGVVIERGLPLAVL